MGKVSMTHKMPMQTLHEQGIGVKAIIAAYPDKQWKLSTVKKYAAALMKWDRVWNVVRAAKAEICPQYNKYRSCRRTRWIMTCGELCWRNTTICDQSQTR